ncbi:hypothetical protein B0I28_108287 [Glycomyces artemisiae]|uniref:Uncharacterized protein n=1 Tax=Glycomyces artemisiae TaxID=1076443 RepID=A0A2T0UGI7_9ACTN|nr:hypothetical protein B0I28_108287 [Glycomyces artemisiae]
MAARATADVWPGSGRGSTSRRRRSGGFGRACVAGLGRRWGWSSVINDGVVAAGLVCAAVAGRCLVGVHAGGDGGARRRFDVRRRAGAAFGSRLVRAATERRGIGSACVAGAGRGRLPVVPACSRGRGADSGRGCGSGSGCGVVVVCMVCHLLRRCGLVGFLASGPWSAAGLRAPGLSASAGAVPVLGDAASAVSLVPPVLLSSCPSPRLRSRSLFRDRISSGVRGLVPRFPVPPCGCPVGVRSRGHARCLAGLVLPVGVLAARRESAPVGAGVCPRSGDASLWAGLRPCRGGAVVGRGRRGAGLRVWGWCRGAGSSNARPGAAPPAVCAVAACGVCSASSVAWCSGRVPRSGHRPGSR